MRSSNHRSRELGLGRASNLGVGGPKVHAIAVLLLAALFMVSLLTMRANYAITSHRAMAEEVLRDYAALVGDEALRRIALEVGIYGYRQGLGDLRNLLDPSAPRPLSREELAASLEGSGKRNAELMARTFVYQRAAGGGPPSSQPGKLFVRRDNPEIDSWLVSELAGLALEGESGFEVLHAELEGAPVSVVVGALDESNSVLVGFEVDRSAVSRWCGEALERPLLPPTLDNNRQGEDPPGGNKSGNRAIFLRVLDSQGRELYALGEKAEAGLEVERSLPDDYLTVLDGLRVVAGIRPDAAEQLVIGGLPRSDLPTLLTMLGLIGGLMLAAALLLRRERELVRLRTDFVSRVSHELRTPLAQIRIFTETLRLNRVRNDEERNRSLEIMDRESRRLSSLVENILQFSRAERGTMQIAPRRFNAADLLHRLASELEVVALPAGAQLEVDAPEMLEIEADEDALRQIVINLVDNAIKYGPAGQSITLGADRFDGSVRLWVDDQGPGVPEADRDRIWQPFLRTDAARQAAGTGIGLAVVRELVHQHGGRCWIEARSMNGAEENGARVVVELPDRRGGRDELSDPLGEVP